MYLYVHLLVVFLIPLNCLEWNSFVNFTRQKLRNFSLFLIIFIFVIYLDRTTTRASPVGIPRDIYSTYCKLEWFHRIVCSYAIIVVLQLDINVDVVIGSGRVLIVLAACGRWC